MDQPPARRKLPDTRPSIIHKFNINGHEGYVCVGLYDNGKPGEVFITVAKEGSTVGGLMGVIAILVSLALQYGVPIEVITDKLKDCRFEPNGYTTNPKIKYASSIVDYIFRWVESMFTKKEEAPPS